MTAPEGVCHVTLTFHHAADFVSDINVTRSGASCCSGLMPERGLVNAPEEPADASTRN